MGCIRHTFLHMDNDMFLLLYKTHVRPHLEYVNQVWYPTLQKDIDAVENVQRRACKMLPGMRDLSYEARLKKLCLPTLVYRRLRGSMIETYKSLNIYDNKITPTLTRSISITRGNTQKLFTNRCNKTHPKKHSFNIRVVAPWNSLPNHTVCSPNLPTFKARLDKWWANQPVKYDYRADLIIGHQRHSRTPQQHTDLDIEA